MRSVVGVPGLVMAVRPRWRRTGACRFSAPGIQVVRFTKKPLAWGQTALF